MRLEIAKLLPAAGGCDSPNEFYVSFVSELTTSSESISKAVTNAVRDARRARRADAVTVGKTYAAPFEERPGRASYWYRARVLQILVPGPSTPSAHLLYSTLQCILFLLCCTVHIEYHSLRCELQLLQCAVLCYAEVDTYVPSDLESVSLAGSSLKFQYQLLFIDFAAKKFLQAELYELPKHLAEERALSHRCRLYGIGPVQRGSLLFCTSCSYVY